MTENGAAASAAVIVDNNNKGDKNEKPINRGKYRTQMQRQATFTTAKYRYRKSISQIDMKLARRNGMLHFSPAHKKRLSNELNQRCVEDELDAAAAAAAGITTGNGSYFNIEPINQELIAGMRVYMTFLLNAWRKRREDVKNQAAQIAVLKKCNTKSKNQVHVLNSLFNVEKNSCEELGQQLKTMMEQNRMLQETESQLKASLAQSETKCLNTEQQLMVKMQDHHALNIFFKQTKTELFSVMSELQETRAKLDTEQLKTQQLEGEKLELMKNMEVMQECVRDENETLLNKLQNKELEALCMRAQIKNLSIEVVKTKEALGAQICNLSNSEVHLKTELEALQSEVKLLRRCLAATMGQRVQNCWKKSILMQRATFQMAHWFTASVLPAVPPPKVILNPLPLNFTLEKALNCIMKR